jgi:hypothetical protein
MPRERLGGGPPAVEQMKRKLSGLETEAGRLDGLSLALRPSDVVIATTPKAGTTMVQQLVHQLRSGGDDAFDEISQQVPWIELAHDHGIDIHGDQRFHPRAFKTHLWHPSLPRGGRRIVVLRRPTDVLSSLYHFFEGWFFRPGDIRLSEFAHAFWLSRGTPSSDLENAGFAEHLVSWWRQRRSDDTLVLLYEDLVRDLPREVRRVSNFLSLGTSEPVQADAVKRTSFEYMKAREHQFDEHLTKEARNKACGLPEDAGMHGSKVGLVHVWEALHVLLILCTFEELQVRVGQPGRGGAEVRVRERLAIAVRWLKVVFPVTLAPSYGLLVQRLKMERALGLAR